MASGSVCVSAWVQPNANCENNRLLRRTLLTTQVFAHYKRTTPHNEQQHTSGTTEQQEAGEVSWLGTGIAFHTKHSAALHLTHSTQRRVSGIKR